MAQMDEVESGEGGEWGWGGKIRLILLILRGGDELYCTLLSLKALRPQSPAR